MSRVLISVVQRQAQPMKCGGVKLHDVALATQGRTMEGAAPGCTPRTEAKMNILIASVDALPRMGGVSMMSHSLASAFEALGSRVYFLGPKGTVVPVDYEQSYWLIEDIASNVRARSGPESQAEDRRIECLVDKIIRRYEIDAIINMHPFYYAPGTVSAARRARKWVGTYFHGFEYKSQVHAHGCRSHYDSNDGLSLGARMLDVARRSSAVLVNSNYTKELLSEVRDEHDIRVTGCGVDGALLGRAACLDSPAMTPSSGKSPCDEPGRYMTTLGFVGRLVKHKRVDRVLRITATHSRFRAVIIGDGPEEDSLRKMARDLSIENRVHWCGRVTEEEKLERLRECDFVLLLSEEVQETGHVEGFGIALLEGIACGAVPVTSGSGGMRDIVRSEAYGVELSEDVGADGLRLLKVARSREELQFRLENAQRLVRDEYNWMSVASVIMRTIEGRG